MSDVTDDHTKKRQHDQTRSLHNGLTKGKLDSGIQYENAPSRGLPGIFSSPEPKAHKVSL